MTRNPILAIAALALLADAAEHEHPRGGEPTAKRLKQAMDDPAQIQLRVTKANGSLIIFQNQIFNADSTLATVKSALELSEGIPTADQQLFCEHSTSELEDTETLGSLGFTNGVAEMTFITRTKVPPVVFDFDDKGSNIQLSNDGVTAINNGDTPALVRVGKRQTETEDAAVQEGWHFKQDACSVTKFRVDSGDTQFLVVADTPGHDFTKDIPPEACYESQGVRTTKSGEMFVNPGNTPLPQSQIEAAATKHDHREPNAGRWAENEEKCEADDFYDRPAPSNDLCKLEKIKWDGQKWIKTDSDDAYDYKFEADTGPDTLFKDLSPSQQCSAAGGTWARNWLKQGVEYISYETAESRAPCDFFESSRSEAISTVLAPGDTLTVELGHIWRRERGRHWVESEEDLNTMDPEGRICVDKSEEVAPELDMHGVYYTLDRTAGEHDADSEEDNEVGPMSGADDEDIHTGKLQAGSQEFPAEFTATVRKVTATVRKTGSCGSCKISLAVWLEPGSQVTILDMEPELWEKTGPGGDEKPGGDGVRPGEIRGSWRWKGGYFAKLSERTHTAIEMYKPANVY